MARIASFCEKPAEAVAAATNVTRNLLLVLSCLSAKMSGTRSAALVARAGLDLAIGVLDKDNEDHPPILTLYALIALEAFAMAAPTLKPLIMGRLIVSSSSSSAAATNRLADLKDRATSSSRRHRHLDDDQQRHVLDQIAFLSHYLLDNLCKLNTNNDNNKFVKVSCFFLSILFVFFQVTPEAHVFSYLIQQQQQQEENKNTGVVHVRLNDADKSENLKLSVNGLQVRAI